MKILICEDEEILLTALELRLRKQGFEIKIGKRGALAKEVIQEALPDLIVLSLDSLQHPVDEWLSGAVTEQKKGIPLILIGNTEDGEELLRLLKKGAKDFMIKPFKPAELVLRIRKVLAAE